MKSIFSQPDEPAYIPGIPIDTEEKVGKTPTPREKREEDYIAAPIPKYL